MDGFKSIVFLNEGPRDENGHLMFDFHPGGVTSLEGADMDTNDLVVNADEFGWNNGGLERILRSREGFMPNMPLFFRSHALFDNIVDAMNEYLMNPDIDHEVDGVSGYHPEHEPFGMVIPSYKPDTLDLVGATIILFWQEQ
jgi:hypothetical protein